jgi:multidrug resistance efflux pump
MEQAEAGYEGHSGPHARDVGAMFDELKALADRHAELHADRARLQAELDQARAELARARRPWWRRVISC